MIQFGIDFDTPARMGSDAFIGTTAAIIAGLAAAGGSIAGSAIQAHGASEAAQTQSDAAAKAGAYSQQATQQALGYIGQAQQGIQHAPTYTGVTPFGGGSSGAYGTMSRLMGGQAPPMAMPNQSGTNLPIAPSYAGMFGGQTSSAPNAGTVMMQSPNGSQTRAVPANLVDHYTAQGARRL